MKERMWHVSLLLAIWLTLIIYPGAQGQQEAQQGEGTKCPHAWVITRERAGAGDKGEAWTTETSNRDGVLSVTYCWVFKDGPTTISYLSPQQLTDLPDGFSAHIAYGNLVGEKIR